MSEKRFTYGETIDYNFFDVFEEKKYLGMIQRDSTKIVDRLNELAEENDKLKGLIKGNVFGMYGEGSLADLKFKATAYDDIVKLKMSYESEPKVIVICKQGKKENVKSFCQMFIPFGVYYEIKEIIE